MDLGARTHGHQDTAALGRMAATILHTVLDRVDPDRPRSPKLTQFRRADGRVVPVETTVTGVRRPPMASVLRS